jgi:L-amino acid N-acyltransferase YncA
MATADLEPVDVASREAWFAEFDPTRRPLYVSTRNRSNDVAAWLSLRSFYGRPAYAETVEVGLYTAPEAQRQGHGRSLLAHALAAAPALGVSRLLAFTFAHNARSLALFRGFGFLDWGRLPGVAVLDGVRRDLLILGCET